MKKRVSFLMCLLVCASMAMSAVAAPAGDAAAQEVQGVEAAEGASEGGESAQGESAGGESAEGESTDGESAEGESEGGSGGAPMMNYGETNEENSVLVAMNGEVSVNDAAGSYELAEGGSIENRISGVHVIGADTRSNGIYVGGDTDDAVFTVGGDELYYPVEKYGRDFNTVIEVQGVEEDEDKECGYGVGITGLGGILEVKNAYIHTSGYRSSAIYTAKGDHETNLVVKDSVLVADGGAESFIPDFKLLVGSARATLMLGEDIWFYNSKVLSQDWGALSHDENTSDIQLYAVNTYAETRKGGYALYGLNGTENFLYGTKFVSPEYGFFIMGSGTVILDNIDAADEAALKYAEGEDFSESITGDGRAVVAAGCNAAVFHVSGWIQDPGTLTVKNATLSTMPEDVVSDVGNELHFDLDSYLLNPVQYGESWFYMTECKGSLIVTRTHGGTISFEEGAELKSANGVLVETMLEYDNGSASATFRDSTSMTNELKDVVINVNTAVAGDILHRDYQRDMYLNINAAYIGQVLAGTITTWNNLWTAQSMQAMLDANGMTDKFTLDEETVANIRSCLVREEAEAYTEIFGIHMNVAAGASWTVQDKSSVTSLTVEDGAQITAAEIYVDCAYGEDGYLDQATGTKVDGLEAGTYANVVLIG